MARENMIRFIEWLWGYKLGTKPFVKSWWPSPDNGGCPHDWREWGIAWPCLGDRKEGGTRTPIWNWVWLRNRLGFPYKEPDGPLAM
jgi:hypothetical protein